MFPVCENGDGGARVLSNNRNISMVTFPNQEKSQYWTELLMGNGGFIYKMVSRKLSDLIEESKRK